MRKGLKTMEIKQMLHGSGLKNHPRASQVPSSITIHNTGNYDAKANAEMHAAYIATGSGGTETSWHYTVDARNIYQSFEDNEACWHTGTTKGNYSSIGIEICVNDKAEFPQACKNAAWLTATLLKRHNLLLSNVKQHYDWSGKDCPAELRSGRWGVTWNDFTSCVKDEMEYVTKVGNVKAVNQPVDDLQIYDVPSNWAKEDWTWGIENGITDGTNPRDYITREQVIAMIHRHDSQASLAVK
jgi:N-acetylmuramoyl-L-alanine amidase CwlA